MRNGHDITCKAPLGEELYYQITTYLIDAVYKGSDKLYKTHIIADVDNSKLESANAVGTGISCGIDSFHSIAAHTNTKFKNHNITHLAFNNVGSHGEGERAIQLYGERKKRAMKFAKENHFEFVESNSNIHDIIPQNHFLTHSYTSGFAIFALQKLYSIYYYASGNCILDFSLKDTYNNSCGQYDLLLLETFSTSTLKLFSEGSTLSRYEKTKQVVEYSPSYKYLNVCTETSENCGRCEKCTRTLLAIDALEKLDSYKEVFDIDYYKKNKQDYYSFLVYCYLIKKDYYSELYPLLKNKIKFTSKIRGFVKAIKPLSTGLIPKKIKFFLKKKFRKL